jgi:hypothetical protein
MVLPITMGAGAKRLQQTEPSFLLYGDDLFMPIEVRRNRALPNRESQNLRIAEKCGSPRSVSSDCPLQRAQEVQDVLYLRWVEIIEVTQNSVCF